MRLSPLSDLSPLAKGIAFLWRHPWWTLGLSLLTVLLSSLGPILQIWTPVPGDPTASMVLGVACLVPLELYFLPRFLLFLDAETLNPAQNPLEGWKGTFEVRWMRAFAAKLCLYLSVFAGAACLVVPGLVILAFFGWTPWRVLLRGDALKEGAKASARLMVRLWPRVLLPVCGMLAVYTLVLMGAMRFEDAFVPESLTPWIRLTRPAVWAIDLAGSLLNLWISTTSLAVYHHLERLHLAAQVPSEPTS